MTTSSAVLEGRPLQGSTEVSEPVESVTLRVSVERAMSNYFMHLDGQDATNVYDMVLAEVEAPLLECVLRYVRGNQTRAAVMLGLNRGTLRKKLKQYGLL